MYPLDLSIAKLVYPLRLCVATGLHCVDLLSPGSRLVGDRSLQIDLVGIAFRYCISTSLGRDLVFPYSPLIA